MTVDVKPELMRHVRLNDDPYCDEIHVRAEPRYKESGLSGDEWRESYVVEYKRKGVVIKRERYSRMQWAANTIPSQLPTAPASIDTDFMPLEGQERLGVDYCTQIGCPETPTVWYRLKAHYCREGHRSEINWTAEIRGFCDRHKTRGDCGLDDADRNYELLPGRPEGAF